VQYCEWCFGPLDVVIEPARVDRAGMRETPLVPAPRLGERVGLGDLWLKDETAQPTGSFKDRVVATAAARARRTGSPVLACSSTGNLARAVAAVPGFRRVVLVPGSLAVGEQQRLAGLGATVVAVGGDYDAANRLAAEASEAWPAWGWVNGNLRPWYGLGGVALGAELLDQGPSPDQLVVPMASGALAYQLATTIPSARLVVGQPEGCAPVATAWAEGVDEVRPVRPATAVANLAMGDPPDGPDVLVRARRSGGAVLAVAEGAVAGWAAAVEECAGLPVDPAVGVAVGAAVEAVARGILDPATRTVLVVTGGPPRWPAPVGGPGGTVSIEATLEALAAVVDGEEQH